MAPTPVIALTPGEPAGIGPDLCVQAAQRGFSSPLVAIADPELLATRARELRLPLVLREAHGDLHILPPGELWVDPAPLARPAQAGKLDTANAAAVLATLDRAVDGCLDGSYAAMVTGPVHKGLINDAGFAFSGHTEYLATRCGAPLPVMMLTAPGLRVALVTTHLPLSRVAEAITATRLEQTLRILHAALQRDFALHDPRILVCGLNPHAGEGGHLGHEEIEVINPVLDKLRQQGMQLSGALPADTLFTPAHLDGADAVLAQYHDQGLPVLKHVGFGNAVNITLGLPIVRTSVDHGTALDLAGSGRADCGSLETAVGTAHEIVNNRLRPA